jgi:hypothetical protein
MLRKDGDMAMSRVTTVVYVGVAILLQVLLAGVYLKVVPGLRQVYSTVFVGVPMLPATTIFFLTHRWLFYLPPLLLAAAGIMAWWKGREALVQHALFWSMASFLALGFIHAVALYLPFVVVLP